MQYQSLQVPQLCNDKTIIISTMQNWQQVSPKRLCLENSGHFLKASLYPGRAEGLSSLISLITTSQLKKITTTTVYLILLLTQPPLLILSMKPPSYCNLHPSPIPRTHIFWHLENLSIQILGF